MRGSQERKQGMTIKHEWSRWPNALTVDRDYEENTVTFTIEEDTMPTLSVTMSIEEARALTKGLH